MKPEALVGYALCGLLGVLPGSHITMEQTRVGDGIWMPKHIEVRAAAKIFFIKSLIIDKVLTYSGYRPAQTGITATGGDRAVP